MNKPSSELIALADRISGSLGPFNFITRAERELVVQALRTAANQSGSERAGVDALRERIVELRDLHGSPTGTAYKNGIWDQSQRIISILATPPAQPAPESDGIESGPVTEKEYDEYLAGIVARTSSDGGVEGHARTCDGPADPPSGGVTQAGHSPLIASDQERNRVRKEAGIKPGPSDLMTDDQIKHMVDRFLGWKLPEDFKPDGGVSYEPFGNAGTPHQYAHRPSGTNLFDATQADAMVRYMLDGISSHSPKAAETGPGDVHAMKEACKRVVLDHAPGVDDPTSTYIADICERIAEEIDAIPVANCSDDVVALLREGVADMESFRRLEWKKRAQPAIDRLDVKAEAKSQEPAVLTNSALRQMWCEAGGNFHGPHVETGTMPEEKLLPFLRSLTHPTTKPEAKSQEPEAVASYPWPKAILVRRDGRNYWHGDISFARKPTDAEIDALGQFLRDHHENTTKPEAPAVLSALLEAAVEFLSSGEGLHKIQINGQMMDRKALATAIAALIAGSR